jgi:molecular chaperone DnaK
MKEMGDKLAGSDKAALESAIASLKSAVDGGNTGTMKSAMETLTQARHKAAEALYKQPGPGGPSGPAPGAEPGSGARPADGDVIDAEVVEDEKK